MTSVAQPQAQRAPSATDPTPAIEGRGLAAGYPGSMVWSKADFSIERGEFVAVLGPNGAGKTTLLRMVLGLLPPLAGDLLVLGAPPHRGSSQIGYVPQTQFSDPQMALRVVDLVGLGLDGHRFGFALPNAGRAKRQMVDEALDAVGLARLANRPVGRLSGGERQRLFLAQALVSRPAILLLDEPLANLDVRNQALVADLVKRVARDRDITVVLVAHDLNPLRQVLDRVCYVAGGGVAIGTPEEIVTGPVLSRLYGAPVEVLTDSRGRRFVVGLEEETAHPHGGHEPGEDHR